MDNLERTGNIGHTRRRQTKQKFNTTQYVLVTNMPNQIQKNIIKTRVLLQITGGKDDVEI